MDNDRRILRATFSKDISDEAITRLYEAGTVVTYPPRKFLCRQGEFADKLYIMLDGWASVYSEIDDDLYHIDNIRSGTFGEIALMLKGVRNAHIMTREESRVLEITSNTYEELQKSHPEIVIELAKMVLRRILEQDKRNLVKLKARKEQIVQQKPQTLNEKMIKTMFEELPVDAIARELFARQSIYGVPKTDKQYQTDVFMVMPFDPNLRPVFEHIRNVCSERDINLTIKRGDDFFSRNAIMSEIWAVTNAARLIICDCTGKNPNVFYELGIAHTLGKPTIMITQDAADVPFDLRSYRYIRYDNTPAGMLDLANQLREAIRKILASLEPSASTSTPSSLG
ncbi:MAG: cyclic nucleotide-binding domain-containing protein [Chloroflexi bacterium]|nr:cyclic nucleotide-binding domain-containing protein [Chloroflexota bacterium]